MKAALLGLAAAAAVACGCARAPEYDKPPVPVQVHVVQLAEPKAPARYSATIRPDVQVDLAFKAGGHVESLATRRDQDGRERSIQEGDLVQKGDLLARLRRKDYELKLAQASSAQAEAQAACEQAACQLREAEAALRQAEHEARRALELYGTASMTVTERDAAVARRDGARARVGTARASIGLCAARRERAAAVHDEAGTALADSELRSPLEGVVLRRMVEVGSLAGPGSLGFVVASTARLKAVFGVPDVAVRNLRLGSPQAVRAEGALRFTGTITRIAPSADPLLRVFEVEVGIPEPAGKLRIGQVVSLDLQDGLSADRLPSAPLSAVVRAPGTEEAYAVYVIESEKSQSSVTMRRVQLGGLAGGNVLVTAGLAAGDRIVAHGGGLLHDGQAVLEVP